MPYTDEYDYESDSDLEDDEIPDVDVDETAPPSSSRRGQRQDNYSEQPMLTSVVDGKKRSTTSSGSPGGPLKPHNEQCRQIVVRDAAYHTYGVIPNYSIVHTTLLTVGQVARICVLPLLREGQFPATQIRGCAEQNSRVHAGHRRPRSRSPMLSQVDVSTSREGIRSSWR